MYISLRLGLLEIAPQLWPETKNIYSKHYLLTKTSEQSYLKVYFGYGTLENIMMDQAVATI